MDLLVNDFAAGIFHDPEPPCLSLYQPTHRSFPDRKSDQIRFRNLVKTLEESLRQKYPSRHVAPLLEPFQALASDWSFWTYTLDGLAVLGARDFFRVYRLQRPVPELAVVADTFHLKPLVRMVQSADGYHILGLSRDRIKLFEGNRDVLDEVGLSSAVPRTSTEVLGDDSGQVPRTARAHGRAAKGVVFGLGSKSEVIDVDTERYFRAVDRAILEQYSQPSGMPLLLASVPENISLFRQLSRNPYLMDEEIDVHPDSLSIDELRDRAWRVVEPHYLNRLAGLIEMFGTARSRELGSDDVSDVARSAAAGRVATLLVEADRHVPGRIDPASGAIEFDDLADPEVDDLLDDIGELVLKNGGQIVVVPAARMPTQTGLAAIYRF